MRGQVRARSDAGAFERLKRDGLSPVRITPAKRGAGLAASSSVKGLGQRESAELLSDLSALLRAGSDMRTALSIVGAKADRPALREVCKALSAEISGGGALDRAFARNLSAKQGFIAALIAAGEASGDLAGGLQRAADILESRLKIREQLWSVLSYPLFVLASTIAALAVILLLVVPSLAPLAEAEGANPGLPMKILLGVSGFLRGNLAVLVAGMLTVAGGLFVAARGGLLGPFIDGLALDGPIRRTARGVVFGGFAIALGNVLAAGAPMGEALRLATRSVRSERARKRLEPVAHAVRQGEALSSALGRVAGFPGTVVRLAAIGEQSGALGAMLARAGTMEEAAAIRRIEAASRLLGPALIVSLGAIIGLLMAGLLSGVSGLGDAALQ
ncbi:MAG: type II secretion system F family protein [Proteobacteria bacterium]|nr:type II secretion system F family protein [Pseudomonadota bacterium]